jgi:catechol 2,3-dioxygenase-like lactoylglutathione lyase family enzyme
MSVSLGSVVLNVQDLSRAAEFWKQALGYVSEPRNPAFLAPADGTGPRLHLDEDDRTHLELWVNRDNSDVQTQVDRLLTLGAQRVDWNYPEGADFVVLADTEGNLFCVIA